MIKKGSGISMILWEYCMNNCAYHEKNKYAKRMHKDILKYIDTYKIPKELLPIFKGKLTISKIKYTRK